MNAPRVLVYYYLGEITPYRVSCAINSRAVKINVSRKGNIQSPENRKTSAYFRRCTLHVWRRELIIARFQWRFCTEFSNVCVNFHALSHSWNANSLFKHEIHYNNGEKHNKIVHMKQHWTICVSGIHSLKCRLNTYHLKTCCKWENCVALIETVRCCQTYNRSIFSLFIPLKCWLCVDSPKRK